MSKKYEDQLPSRAIGLTTGSILAIMVAMGLYVIADLGSQMAQVESVAVAAAPQSLA